MPVLVTLPENGRFGSAMKGILSDDILRQVIGLLEGLAWHEARREFYRQREENLTHHPAFKKIFHHSMRDQIAERVGAFFGDDVASDFDISAHKMIKGDYIAPHTDENTHGERYRLTITLNESWRSEDGGILLILKDGDVRSISDAWLPTCNNGFIFRICSSSYHAVTPVLSDRARLSLILTFKRKREDAPERTPDPWYPFPWEPDLKQAIFNAAAMGIPSGTFRSNYSFVQFPSADHFRKCLGILHNAPATLSYSDCHARNVDERGLQLKGSDVDRIRALSNYERLPPITIVRRRTGEHVLVNGSHRLSLAVDGNIQIAATVFDE